MVTIKDQQVYEEGEVFAVEQLWKPLDVNVEQIFDDDDSVVVRVDQRLELLEEQIGAGRKLVGVGNDSDEQVDYVFVPIQEFAFAHLNHY